jgi:hypothetical protein
MTNDGSGGPTHAYSALEAHTFRPESGNDDDRAVLTIFLNRNVRP